MSILARDIFATKKLNGVVFVFTLSVSKTVSKCWHGVVPVLS
jgi:hypothetical protein